MCGDEEGVTDVGGSGGEALADAATMSLPEGQGDLSGASGVLEAHPVVAGGTLREGHERTAGGETELEGGPHRLVDEELEVSEEKSERSGKRPRELEHQCSSNAHTKVSEIRGINASRSVECER